MIICIYCKQIKVEMIILGALNIIVMLLIQGNIVCKY